MAEGERKNSVLCVRGKSWLKRHTLRELYTDEAVRI
jgi:hypothetical protein